MSVNITDPGQNDDEARASAEGFRSLVQNLSDIVSIFGTDGSVRFVSPSVESVLGYRAGEPPRGNIFAYIHPDDVERARAAVTREATDAAHHGPIELRVRHADGTWRVLEVSVSNLLADPNVGGIVAVARDITQRKRVEDALRFLAEASAILTGPLDGEAALEDLADLAARRVADWCLIDLIETDGDVRRIVAHADPAHRARSALVQRCFPLGAEAAHGPGRAMQTGRAELVSTIPDTVLATAAHDEGDLDALRNLGLTSYVVAPLIGRRGTLGAVTLITAESGHRYRPAALELVQEIARRAALALENARLYREAQEAVRIRDEFLFSVTHDLQAPLTTIKGHAQLLLRSLERGETIDLQSLTEGLARIDAATTKMAGQIAELLDLALLESGRPLPLDRRPTDLVALVRRLAAEPPAVAGRARVAVVAEAPNLVGIWDAARLERVVENLYSNAIKYSPTGGSVVATVRRVENHSGRWAELVVRDEGIGIPAADLPHIFSRFHRGANVAGRIAGTGIGLAGAKQIVEQHHGTIRIESREGEGTAVTVRLPL